MTDYPTEADLSTLQARLEGHHLQALLTLAKVSGMRRDELLHLRWQQIDWEQREIQISDSKRTSHARLVPLPEEVAQSLLQHRLRQRERRRKAGLAWEEQDLVFPDHLGRPFSSERFVRVWQEALQQVGVPNLPFHEVRRLVWRRLYQQRVGDQEGGGTGEKMPDPDKHWE
jgi:integrase